MANNKNIVDKILSMDDDFKPRSTSIRSLFTHRDKNATKIAQPVVVEKNQQSIPEKNVAVAERNNDILTVKLDNVIDDQPKSITKKIDLSLAQQSSQISIKQKDSGIKIKKEISSLQDINRNTMVQILSNREKTFSKTFNIKIIGIGGAGNNIVKYMVTEQEWPDFVDVIALNTDYVALSNIGNSLKNIFILGAEELNGNGSGGDPNVGERAAESDIETIKQLIDGTDVLILVAGLGKGTGTGATPIIAKAAQDMGILTIGVFNLPSIGAEGNKTYSNALFGLQKLSYVCNGLTTVNNDKIINLDKEKTSIKKAYQGANKYIKTIVEEIIEIIVKPSDINVDFADVKNFFQDKNGFLFSRVSLSDYTKDAIKDQLENSIKQGFSEINYKGSEKALINFKLNENVPSIILENTRSALKELVDSGNINIVHGVAYNDIFENAEINILLTGSFELGAIEDIDSKSADIDDEKQSIPSKNPIKEMSVYDTLKDLETSTTSILKNSNSWESLTSSLSNDSKNNFYSTSKFMSDDDADEEYNFKRPIQSNQNKYSNDFFNSNNSTSSLNDFGTSKTNDFRRNSRKSFDDDYDDYDRDSRERRKPKKENFLMKLFKKRKKNDEDY